MCEEEVWKNRKSILSGTKIQHTNKNEGMRIRRNDIEISQEYTHCGTRN